MSKGVLKHSRGLTSPRVRFGIEQLRRKHRRRVREGDGVRLPADDQHRAVWQDDAVGEGTSVCHVRQLRDGRCRAYVAQLDQVGVGRGVRVLV